MRPYEPDVGNLKFVLDGDHQAIGVSFDVEHDPVVTENARRPVFRFNILGTLPSCLFGFGIPRSQGPFCVGVALPEKLQRSDRDNPHEVIYTVPNLGTSPIGVCG